jgi:hypothetical protein
VGTIDWFEGWRPPDGGGAWPDIVASATRLVCSAPVDRTVFYTTEDRDEIAALAAALRTEPPSDVQRHCWCVGTLVFTLDGPRPISVTLHHGESLRWGASGGNLALLEPDAVMDWLSARGMGFVREQYEADRRRSNEAEARARRWRAALPASMVPFFDRAMDGDGDGDGNDWPRLIAAIEAELPDPVARARVLLDLFGYEPVPWSGFPLYELQAQQLLIGFPLYVLLAAIGDAPDARRREGAARLFCGAHFGRARAADLAKLPPALQQLLLAHVESSSDPGNRHRARAVLGRR